MGRDLASPTSSEDALSRPKLRNEVLGTPREVRAPRPRPLSHVGL